MVTGDTERSSLESELFIINDIYILRNSTVCVLHTLKDNGELREANQTNTIMSNKIQKKALQLLNNSKVQQKNRRKRQN